MLERPLIKGVVHISCLQCGNVMCSPGKGAVIQGLEQGLNITNFRICCGNKIRSFFQRQVNTIEGPRLFYEIRDF